MSSDMIVISDSRGRFLQEYLPAEGIKVLYYSGATLVDIVKLSHAQCTSMKPKHILVMGGICNMSQKNRQTREITLRFDNEENLLTHMKSVFYEAWELAHNLYPNVNVMFAGLCGLDLNCCNGLYGYHRLQPVIDNVIDLLNQFIVEL